MDVFEEERWTDLDFYQNHWRRGQAHYYLGETSYFVTNTLSNCKGVQLLTLNGRVLIFIIAFDRTSTPFGTGVHITKRRCEKVYY